MNIKCRQAGLEPDAVVLVATVRALKYHGGMAIKELDEPNDEALEAGAENLRKHIENIRQFGVPVVVAVNAFANDTPDELHLVQHKCDYLGVDTVSSDHWARGGDSNAQMPNINCARAVDRQLSMPATSSRG